LTALREATEALKKTQAELANANSRLTEIEKRLTEAESALRKERSELNSNTHSIKIKMQNSWRHANGIIYVGVEDLDPDPAFCNVVGSSDTVDSTNSRFLSLAEALTIPSSQGKHRLVLRAVEKDSCTFDLIKD